MYYRIDDIQRVFDDIEDVLDYCLNIDYYLDNEDAFCEYLDEVYPRYEVAGLTLDPSDVLYHTASEAYADLKMEWAQQELDDDFERFRDILSRMDPGDEEYVNGYDVCAFEDEPEEEGPVEVSENTIKSLESKLDMMKKIQEEATKKQKETEDQFSAMIQLI